MKKFASLIALLLCGLLLLTACSSSADPFAAIDPDEYITLGRYKGLSLDAVDNDWKTALTTAMTNAECFVYIKEGTVQKGDTVNIDFKGLLDGVAFQGGTAEGYHLEIGSGAFIDGFEDGLIGKKVGEKVSLPLTFPENYDKDDLAGKDVVFEVQINSLVEIAELTDEVAKKINPTVSSAEELKELYQADALWAVVLENTTLDQDLPEDLQQLLKDERIGKWEKTMVQQGYESLEAALTANGLTMDVFTEKYITPYLEEDAKSIVAAYAIAKAEGYAVTEEIFNEKAAEFAKLLNYDSTEAFLEETGEEILYYSLTMEFASKTVRSYAKEK